MYTPFRCSAADPDDRPRAVEVPPHLGEQDQLFGHRTSGTQLASSSSTARSILPWVVPSCSSRSVAARAGGMVTPSWKRSTTRGSTYDLRATAGVLPRYFDTSFIAEETARLRALTERDFSTAPARDTSAITVPCQVRKSFAETSPPTTPLM